MIKDILSPREYEVAREIARGYTEDEIVHRLCVAKATVHTHARNLRLKIGARGIGDVTRKFILSLDNPRHFFIAIIMLAIQGTMTINAIDFEARKPTSRIARTIKTARKNYA